MNTEQSYKECFKCGDVFPLSQFYKHSQMRDGHLNKCKMCAKADARERRFDPKFRESVLNYDRRRGNRMASDRMKERDRLNPEKRAAVTLVNNAIRGGKLERGDRCSHCHKKSRLHAHHPDYSRPNAIVWLCVPCHRLLHALKDTESNCVVEF